MRTRRALFALLGHQASRPRPGIMRDTAVRSFAARLHSGFLLPEEIAEPPRLLTPALHPADEFVKANRF